MIWKIIRIILVAVGVIVLAAVFRFVLAGYQLQVSGISNEVFEIRFDRTNQARYEYVNAIGLWEYTKNVAPAFNCRLHSILTFELLTAAGIKARYITCLPEDRNDNDCHVVNEVWLPEIGKWVMIDTDMRRFVTDTKGNMLSLAEMRRHFIDGDKLVVYHEFENASSKISYYHAYMAKNTYWFCCWGDLGFYQEDYTTYPESALRRKYYALIPEGFEPFYNNDYIITHDPEQFWK